MEYLFLNSNVVIFVKWYSHLGLTFPSKVSLHKT